MKKIPLVLCTLVISLMFIVGCIPNTPTDVTFAVETTDETSTVATPTTEISTTAVATTKAPTTVTAEDDVVYAPISQNKFTEDDWEDITPPATERPTKPVTPTKPSSLDEASKPTTPKPSNPTQDKKYKYVAFTFDDGPHWSLTYKFADKLAQYGGRGTFYVVGNRIYGEQANAMKYAYDMGNEIGVHGYTHEYYYSSCSDARFKSELKKTADAIYKYTGEYPLTMRPPGGIITSSRVKSCGYAVINWNVDSADWQYAYQGQWGRNQIVNNVLNSVDNGDIILMHEIYDDSYTSFCKIIDTLYKRGYRFVTVSELLGLSEDSKGNMYYGY